MIRSFSERFDVVAHDYRGLGRSPLPGGPYEMDVLAADAIGLADALRLDSFRVFGVSFGGMVGQELATTQWPRIARLVLACTSAGGAGRSSYPLHTLADLPPDECN